MLFTFDPLGIVSGVTSFIIIGEQIQNKAAILTIEPRLHEEFSFSLVLLNVLRTCFGEGCCIYQINCRTFLPKAFYTP